MSDGATVLFVDGSSGASGDMILGALVDLGVPLARIRRGLEGLPLEGWTLRSRRLVRCGLAARKVDVGVRAKDARGRGWKAIERILRRAGLEPAVRDRSLAIFRRLIEAEAEAHGVPFDEAHLHEVGGIDAIVDVVGCCIGLGHLDPARIVVSPLTTGFGSVRCDHGTYPVPGPATLLLLRGVPARAGEIEVERLTPTGAAILTTIADEWGPMPAMQPRVVGHGAGTRDLGETPNVLRMVLGEDLSIPESPGSVAAPSVVVLECDVDDMTPQDLAHAAEGLLAAGALDATTAPLTMKKGRSGHRLTVLARPDDADALARRILTDTSTLGLRYRSDRRIELAREIRRVRTRFGVVRVKLGFLDGRRVQSWPEFDDCAEAARHHGVPLREVRQSALEALDRPSSAARRRRG